MRQRFLGYLEKNRLATAREPSRVFNVTPADARHHLRLLQSDGLVEVAASSKGFGKGRPEKIYGLSRLARGNNLHSLSDALLTEWLQRMNPQEMDAALDGLCDRLLGGRALDDHAPLQRKLAQCVEGMNQMHYHSRWEARATGPRIIFESCPYLSLIADHPELCALDRKMLEKFLGGRIEQLAKLEPSLKNVPICVFSHRT
jgi:predicted ArsR family transcriptional regulator